MKKSVVVLALLLLPSAVIAQRPRRADRMGADSMAQRNVVAVVLAHKTDLSLTTEQIAKLEPLAKTLEEQNKPVIEELRKQGATRARGMSEEQRNELRAQSEKIRENRTKALEELRTVLNEDQMKKARELIRPEGRRGGK
jgi:hypothetical protein